MKKGLLLTILLCLSMLLSGCSNKTRNFTDIYKVKIETNISTSGGSYKISINSNIKKSDNSYYADVNLSQSNSTYKLHYYYTNGKLYEDDSELKSFTTANSRQAEQAMFLFNTRFPISSKSNTIKSSSELDGLNGLKLNPNVVKNSLDAYIKSALRFSDLNLKNLKYDKVLLSDAKENEKILYFTANDKKQGVTVKYKYTINIGREDGNTVTTPSDLDSYFKK
ncbi:MAG: hypothetical protein Q8865_00825 [Bacillota bacterium]|nr:hypothetical protein [Bacillota bacterium]